MSLIIDRHLRSRHDPFKRPIAFVVIKKIERSPVPVADKKIYKSIPVIIAPGAAETVAAAGDNWTGRDLGKRGIDLEMGQLTGNRSRGVGHYHQIITGVGKLRIRQDQAAAGSVRDLRGVEVPLKMERRNPARRDLESDSGAHAHRLARGLVGDDRLCAGYCRQRNNHKEQTDWKFHVKGVVGLI